MSGIAYFFSDLDRTLIFSHSISFPGEKLAVEHWNGRVQSYMTKNTREYLRSAKWFQLIPVTSRSPVQFRRLSVFYSFFSCKHALVCNGGVLLNEDGEPDQEWLTETIRLSEKAFRPLSAAHQLLLDYLPQEMVSAPMGLMVCARCEQDSKLIARLQALPLAKLLFIVYNGRKVYCFPKPMNKGAALRRYQRLYGRRFAIAAGDSIMDIPMLSSADAAIMPSSLCGIMRQSKKHRVFLPDTPVISDAICTELEKLRVKMLSGERKHEVTPMFQCSEE